MLRLFLDESNVVYGARGTDLAKIADNWTLLTDEQRLQLVNTAGCNESFVALAAAQLGTFRVVTYSETLPTGATGCQLSVKPKSVAVTPKTLIKFQGTLNGVRVTSPPTGNVRVAVTVDLQNYQVFTGSAWVSVDVNDVGDFEKLGLEVGSVDHLPASAWADFDGSKGIAFACLFSADTGNCQLAGLEFTVAGDQRWAKATHGVDYDYAYADDQTLEVTLYSSGDYKVNYAKA